MSVAAAVERVDGFDLDDKLVVVKRHEAPSRMIGGKGELERRRRESIAAVALTDGVVRAVLSPVAGDPIPVSMIELEAILADVYGAEDQHAEA